MATGRHAALDGLGLEAVGLGAADGKVPPLRTDTTGLVEGIDAGGGEATARGSMRWGTRPARSC